MRAPARSVRAGSATLELGGRLWLMGVVNASPDSFSDGGRTPTLAAQIALGEELLAAGADIIDIGGESASTRNPPLRADEETRLVVPLIEALAGAAGARATISIDTYKPAVARAAVAAGAGIVNDVSGLRDPELADVCAQTGAALVVMHTAAAPRERLQDPDLYGDITDEVLGFLRGQVALARERGVGDDQLIVDPGPDFAKTPAQTIRLLSEMERLHELGLPVLMAISRKDFIGALTHTSPRARLPGTLAAVGHAAAHGAHIARIHDVAAAAAFLQVRAALEGELEPPADLALADDLRYEPEEA